MSFQRLIITTRAPRGHPASYAVRKSGDSDHKNLVLHVRPDVVKRLRWSNPQHVDFEFDAKARLFRLVAKLAHSNFRTVKPIGVGKMWTVTMPYRDAVASLFPLVNTVTCLEIVEESSEHLTLKLP